MALPTPGVTPANWGAQLNTEISAAQNAAVNSFPKSGNYVASGYAGTSSTAWAIGDATATPFQVHSRGASFNQAGIRVTTVGTAGAVIRLGVYADSSGYPGALISDWGTVDATVTGDKTVTISWAPTGGIYWLVAACQVAASSTQANAGNANPTPFGISDQYFGNVGAANPAGYGDTMTGALAANWTATLVGRNFTGRVILRAA